VSFYRDGLGLRTEWVVGTELERVLWRNFRAGDVVHYRQWFDLVVADGHRIGGKNPTATFLTQVARVQSVERVGRRSGLYRLVAAA
jgi:hypothetical protein